MDERDLRGDLPPGLVRFGEQLREAARREIDAEHEQVVRSGRRADGTSTRRGISKLFDRGRAARHRPLRGVVLAALLLLAVAATAAAGTALVLRASVIRPPSAVDLPPEQTPQVGTAQVGSPRAADPAGGPAWALRTARSRTGLTCTTVGQVRDGAFGIVGRDGRFRRLPGTVTDACGDDSGTLVGARIVADDDPRAVRSVVYGVGGPELRSATLHSTEGQRTLELGDGGIFVAALRGYPEDRAINVRLAFADGRTERHDLGVAPGILPDPDGSGAWRLERLALGTRQFCVRLGQTRIYDRARQGRQDPRVSTPTACLNRRGERAWVADVRRLEPGDRGVPGFDRWNWHEHPARTVLRGVARSGEAVRAVTLLGAGKPRALEVTSKGTFAAVLPASVDPQGLSLVVRLEDGSVQRERPGNGLADDLVPSRRPR